MKSKKIYVSLILWIFPAYFVIMQSNLAWQSIVIALCVTVILNLDRFKSIGYGDVHAILNDADEKLKTIEELSEIMFLEKINSLFSSSYTVTLLSPKEYETPNTVYKYLEAIDLYSDLNLKKIRKSTYKKIENYKYQAIDDVKSRLLLSIEYDVLTDEDKAHDPIQKTNEMTLKYESKINIIFNDFKNMGVIDLEYGRLIRDQIIENEKANGLLVRDWNLAMHDLNRINEATKRLS